MSIRVYLKSGMVFKLDYNYWQVIESYNLEKDVNGWLYYIYLVIKDKISNPELLAEIIYIIDNWSDDLIKSVC
jgi:hypothetical protein